MSLAPLGSSPVLSISHMRRALQMRERVAEACRLVDSRRTVRGVHIVTNGPLTPEELLSYQAYAASNHVDLTVDSHGMISIRPGEVREK